MTVPDDVKLHTHDLISFHCQSDSVWVVIRYGGSHCRAKNDNIGRIADAAVDLVPRPSFIPRSVLEFGIYVRQHI